MEVNLSEICTLGVEAECNGADYNQIGRFNIQVGAVKTNERTQALISKAFYPGVQRRKKILGINS